MTERPLSRQMGCGECRHEIHLLPCDWCLCDHSTIPGTFPEEAL